MICKDGQKGCDLILPLLIGSEVSFVLIQCKNYAASDPYYCMAQEILTPQNCEITSANEEFLLPYLSIWMTFRYVQPKTLDLQGTPAEPMKQKVISISSNRFLKRILLVTIVVPR